MRMQGRALWPSICLLALCFGYVVVLAVSLLFSVASRRELSALAGEVEHTQCGAGWGELEPTALGGVIASALRMIPTDNTPLCAIEVGTADGTGTTAKLFDALRHQCVSPNGRQFNVYSYESVPHLASQAAYRWRQHPNVNVLCELVISEGLLDPFVLKSIQGPEGDVYPGKGFYERLYRQTSDMVHRGDLGPFFQTKPPCVADLVLIDSTRYMHPGIIATLLAHNVTHPGTVYLVEDDFWSPPAMSERRLIEQHWRLSALTSSHPVGEMWPWTAFRIDGDAQK